MDKIINNQTVIIGEVGLGGEIRSIGQLDKRIQEAEKLGFQEVVIPRNNFKLLRQSPKIKVTPVEYLTEAIQQTVKNG
jgi:DNA repair protein RadA/Sms